MTNWEKALGLLAALGKPSGSPLRAGESGREEGAFGFRVHDTVPATLWDKWKTAQYEFVLQIQ